MFKKSLSFFAVCALLCVLLPATALAAATEEVTMTAAEVTADALNFRSQPVIGNNIIGYAENGDLVVVYAEENNWCRVLFEGHEGWMSKNYLRYMPEADMTLGGAVITGDYVRFRAAPSTDSDVMGFLFTGRSVSVIGVSGEWFKVAYGEQTGYVYSTYVRLVYEGNDVQDNSSLREKLVDTASQQLNISYVWGGQSPDTGFDCSGLIYYAYTTCGVSVYRTAATLYANYTKISSAELQPGDLVFFAGTSGWYVSHVGMYIGDGRFIHASSGAGYVKTNNLSDTYYANHF